MEAKAGHGCVRPTDGAPLVFGPDRTSGIFDHDQTVGGCDTADLTERRRQADLVNDQNGPRSRSDRPLDARRIHVVSGSVDVNKNRTCPGMDNGVSSSYERKARTQNLIPRLDAGGQKGQVQTS